MTSLRKIEGVGETYGNKLEKAGVRSPEQLLENCSTPKTRRMLAERTGIREDMLLRWVNNADLFRIKGVGEEYADLLEASGVDSVPELAQRNARNLCEMMKKCNEERHLVRRLPTMDMVKDWIAQARKLPRMIFY